MKNKSKSKINRSELKDSRGFREANHYTVTKALYKELSRGRRIVIGCLGTPNEMVHIVEVDNNERPTKVNDIVVLHNYDFDRYIDYFKIDLLLKFFKNQ